MFGRLLRAAGAFGALAITGTILSMAHERLTPVISKSPAYNGTAYANTTYNQTATTWFDGIERYWILLGLLAIMLALIYGAWIESKKGGRP